MAISKRMAAAVMGVLLAACGVAAVLRKKRGGRSDTSSGSGSGAWTPTAAPAAPPVTAPPTPPAAPPPADLPTAAEPAATQISEPATAPAVSDAAESASTETTEATVSTTDSGSPEQASDTKVRTLADQAGGFNPGPLPKDTKPGEVLTRDGTATGVPIVPFAGNRVPGKPNSSK